MRINRFTPERGATQPWRRCGNSGRRASAGRRYDRSTCPLPRKLPPGLNGVFELCQALFISQVLDQHQEAKTKSSMSKQLAPLFTSQLPGRPRSASNPGQKAIYWGVCVCVVVVFGECIQLRRFQKKDNSWLMRPMCVFLRVQRRERPSCLNPSAFLSRASAVWS